jgi:hypothetical protein
LLRCLAVPCFRPRAPCSKFWQFASDVSRRTQPKPQLQRREKILSPNCPVHHAVAFWLAPPSSRRDTRSGLGASSPTCHSSSCSWTAARRSRDRENDMSQHRIDIGPSCCPAVRRVQMAILRVLPGTIVDLLLGLFEVFVKLRRRVKVMSLTFHISSSYVLASGTLLPF